MWALLGGTVIGMLAFAGIGFSQDATGEFIGSLFQVILISLMTHRRRDPEAAKAPLLPYFLVAFVLRVVVNSMGWVPVPVHDALTPVSSWCLLTAVAALGVKTSLKSLTEVGPAPIGVMLAQTVFLALFAMGGVALMR